MLTHTHICTTSGRRCVIQRSCGSGHHRQTDGALLAFPVTRCYLHWWPCWLLSWWLSVSLGCSKAHIHKPTRNCFAEVLLSLWWVRSEAAASVSENGLCFSHASPRCVCTFLRLSLCVKFFLLLGSLVIAGFFLFMESKHRFINLV